MRQPDFKQIGNRIRNRRMELHLTQEYVANAVNVNVSHISNIETNKVKVSLSLLINICQILDTTVDYILSDEFSNQESPVENELLTVMRNLSMTKKEQLLRIAKVL